MGDSTENKTPFPERVIDFLTWAHMKSEAAEKDPWALQLFNLISY